MGCGAQLVDEDLLIPMDSPSACGRKLVRTDIRSILLAVQHGPPSRHVRPCVMFGSSPDSAIGPGSCDENPPAVAGPICVRQMVRNEAGPGCLNASVSPRFCRRIMVGAIV